MESDSLRLGLDISIFKHYLGNSNVLLGVRTTIASQKRRPTFYYLKLTVFINSYYPYKISSLDLPSQTRITSI